MIVLQILDEELFARLSEFGLDAPKPLHYHGGHGIGPDAVHLEWDI